MKTTLYSLALAAFACGFAGAQTTAFTTPVGYVTNAISQGFNPIGITVQSPVAVAGVLTAVSGAVLTDSAVADFTVPLPTGRTFIIEITGGPGLGATQDFVSRAGSTMTLPAPIGAAVGSKYQVRVAPTLEDIFGTTTSILKKNNVAGNADNVHVPNGAGGYTRYFLNASSVWRNATVPGLAPLIPVVYLDGLFVQRVDPGTVNLVISGEVKKSSTVQSISQGFNLLGTNFPVGTTLQNLGLDPVLKKNNVAGNADNVYVPNGLGGYTRYFLNASSVWRNATVPGLAPADLPMTSAIFIQRVDPGSVSLTMTPPASYSNL